MPICIWFEEEHVNSYFVQNSRTLKTVWFTKLFFTLWFTKYWQFWPCLMTIYLTTPTYRSTKSVLAVATCCHILFNLYSIGKLGLLTFKTSFASIQANRGRLYNCSLSKLSLGERQGTPWTGRQSITGRHRAIISKWK